MSKSVDALTRLRTQVRGVLVLAMDAYLEADGEAYEYPSNEPDDAGAAEQKEAAGMCLRRVGDATDLLARALNILSGTRP